MIKASEVREMMNRYGKEGTPFLFAVDFEMESGLFELNPLESDKLIFKTGNSDNFAMFWSEISDKTLSELTLSNRDNSLEITLKPQESEYKRSYDTVMSGLLRGDTYLINLTTVTGVRTPLTFEQIALHSVSPYLLAVPGKFVCFSPERFVKIENGVIISCPMKGTIDAAIPDAENKILEDYKESCEHNTITDLIRNDIGVVSKRVWVERFRYTEKIKTDRGEIIQVSSEIKGELKENYTHNLGDLIFSLLPAGSVSGAPKSSTLKLISKSEGGKRGFYTGVFGYFDGHSLDSAVLIRFIEKGKDGNLYYRSGGGITVNSSWDEEYNEVLKKVYLPINQVNSK